MNVLLLNGSPKRRCSNSGYFLHLLKTRLAGCSLEEMKIGGPASDKAIFAKLAKADAVVFAIPVYVDAVPSHVLRFLMEAEKFSRANGCRFRVYVISNCGFYEGKQTRNLMNVVSCWCGRTGVEWCGGVGIGAGEMLSWIRLLPLIACILVLMQFVGGIVSLAAACQAPFPGALTGIGWTSFLIDIAIFLFLSFGLFRAVWILGSRVKKGRAVKRLYTGLTCFPQCLLSFVFILIADLFWMIRAAFNGVGPVRLFRKARPS